MTTVQTDHSPQPSGFLDSMFKVNWVLGPRRDMIFLIGSVLLGWAIWGIYTVLGWNMLLVWFVWVIVLDTPHFYATYSRTYLDKEARKEMRPLLIGSLGVFLFGPAMIALTYFLYYSGVENYQLPWKTIFPIIVSLWAYWHVTRQHYGVLRLYHRKNAEWGTLDAKIDSWLLYGGLLIPLVALIVRHPDARGRIFLDNAVPWLPSMAEGQSYLGYVADLRWEHGVILATIVALVILLSVFFLRQVQRIVTGDKIALPKLMFLAAVLPLHIYICYSDQILLTGLLTFTVIITIYHDIQYLAIVWYYNQNRYKPHEDKEAPRKFGIAASLSKNPALWIGFGILCFAIPVWGLGCAIGRMDERLAMCYNGPDWGQQLILGDTTWIAFFVILTFGFQMHHYVLDQYIWRPSKSKKLREDMKIEES